MGRENFQSPQEAAFSGQRKPESMPTWANEHQRVEFQIQDVISSIGKDKRVGELQPKEQALIQALIAAQKVSDIGNPRYSSEPAVRGKLIPEARQQLQLALQLLDGLEAKPK